jgi:hypothetical protein
MIVLQWKDFQVNLEKVNTYLRTALSDNYDGLICDSESLRVMFHEEASLNDIDIVNNYWDNLTPSSFDSTPEEIAAQIRRDAQEFGMRLMNQFIEENLLLGVTQLGLTNHVRKFLREIKDALETGSLYDAITEIRNLDRSGFDSVIITPARILLFRNEIETKLGKPLATTWDQEETWL